ncbi:MAG: LysR family transcriptional regulator [Acidihalobacter sp.]
MVLRPFEAAGRAESISGAAAELSVSQAVSRQIKDLEAPLGVRLFERIHRGVRLTYEGQRPSLPVGSRRICRCFMRSRSMPMWF